MSKLFIIDGMFLAYRSYYAIMHLTDSKGRPRNAVFGFLKTVKKIIDENNPDYLAVAFDLKGPTFRHLEFKGYKAQRKPTPDDLLVQLPVIKEALSVFNIPILELDGFEADDVMATVATLAEKKNVETFIVSNDKDLMQMVNKTIKMYTLKKEHHVVDENEVKELYHIKNTLSVVDILALSGDAADNIAGVEGVGIKTAIKLISEYETIDHLYANIDTLKEGKLKDRLLFQKEEVFFNKNLIFVKKDVPLEFEIESLKRIEPDISEVVKLLKELEFKTMLKEYDTGSSYQINCLEVIDEDLLLELCKKITKQQELILSLELDNDQLKGLVFSVNDEIYYVDVTFKIASGLQELLANAKIRKVGHNLKLMALYLMKAKVELKGIFFDVEVAAYLLNPSNKSYKLENIVLDYLNENIVLETQEIKKPVLEVFYIAKLKDLLQKELKNKKLDKLFVDVEMPLVAVLSEMELNGITLDLDLLANMSLEVNDDLLKLESQIYGLAGEEFNINSPKILSYILFEKLKLPSQKKTKTGYSTDTEVLEKLIHKHLLPAKILDYRQSMKLKSTYIETLPKLVDLHDGRIHTSFNQTVTATGRLSSSNPNLQNIPIRSDMGRRIRAAFVVSSSSNVFLAADYSQIELRILAHLSGDENLLKAFNHDDDIHTFTAALIFGVEQGEITKEMRDKAKTINFGIIYGMSTYGLANDLKISFAEAKHFIDTYFDRYSGVAEYIDKVIAEAKENKYVSTILNRRRYLPEISSSNLSTRQFAERTAINTVVQGSAADLIKVAMIKISDIIVKKNYAAKMLLQIHDELLFEVKRMDLMLFQEEVMREMENALKLSVPVTVKMQVGVNWGEL